MVNALGRITSEWLERVSEMSENEVETTPVVEEKEPFQVYFDVEMGQSTARVRFTTPEASAKSVIAMALGISERIVYIDETWIIFDEERWYTSKLGIAFHVGANSKGELMAKITWSRY